MTRVPGVAVRHLHLEGPARRAVLRNLGRTLARIHSVPQEPFQASGLFPTDHSHADLVKRLEASFARAATTARQRAVWPFARAPESVAASALALLPESRERVASHSEPGPEHVFADPGTQAYTGLIDFGDAYISHPALDLRRWYAADDRIAVLGGYRGERSVDDQFLATLRVVWVLSAMGGLMQEPEAATASAATLRELVGNL